MCCVYHPWGTPGYLQHHTFTSCLQYRPLESCDHSFGCPAARGSLHNHSERGWNHIKFEKSQTTDRGSRDLSFVYNWDSDGWIPPVILKPVRTSRPRQRWHRLGPFCAHYIMIPFDRHLGDMHGRISALNGITNRRDCRQNTQNINFFSSIWRNLHLCLASKKWWHQLVFTIV